MIWIFFKVGSQLTVYSFSFDKNGKAIDSIGCVIFFSPYVLFLSFLRTLSPLPEPSFPPQFYYNFEYLMLAGGT